MKVGQFIAISVGLSMLGFGTLLVVASLEPSPPGGMVPNYDKLLAPILTAIGAVIGLIGACIIFIASLSGRK